MRSFNSGAGRRYSWWAQNQKSLSRYEKFQVGGGILVKLRTEGKLRTEVTKSSMKSFNSRGWGGGFLVSSEPKSEVLREKFRFMAFVTYQE